MRNSAMVSSMSSVIDTVGRALPTASMARRRVIEFEPQQKAQSQPSRPGMISSKNRRWSPGRVRRRARLACNGSWLKKLCGAWTMPMRGSAKNPTMR